MMSLDLTQVWCRTESVNRMKKLLSKKNGFLTKGDILENVSTAVDEYNDTLEAEIKARSEQ